MESGYWWTPDSVRIFFRIIGEGLLALYRTAYRYLAIPVLFRRKPQRAHDDAMHLLSWCDRSSVLCGLLGLIRRITLVEQPVEIGGVRLPTPLILAAGFVKGHGFSNEEDAMAAVHSGENIIPGWRAMSQLAGPVEFGSFTPRPRMGNTDTIMWRDPSTRSLQNRVGLRNPGAQAAAAFLAQHRRHLPACYGINIAVSPGQNDQEIATREVLHAIETFVRHQIYPSWYTLNISCPNTEDDPGGRQTESASRDMCAAVVRLLNSEEHQIPLWVKLGPDLAPEQYRVLARVMHEVGVRAIVATNTIPMPVPGDTNTTAGVGGGRLYDKALAVAKLLIEEQQNHGYNFDVIGCGGVLDGASYHAYKEVGVKVVQYWSALVYRGPLAAAVIGKEEREYARARGRRGVTGNRRGRVRATRANHI